MTPSLSFYRSAFCGISALIIICTLSLCLLILKITRPQPTPYEAQMVFAGDFAFSIPSGWRTFSPKSFPSVIAEHDEAQLTITSIGRISKDWLSNPPKLSHDDLRSTVENLPFGGEMVSHLYTESGRVIREGFIIRDGRYAQFSASYLGKLSDLFEPTDSPPELYWILRNVKGAL